MIRYLAFAAVVACAAGVIWLWVQSERRNAVLDERRERMGDAIELIRETDKMLGVARKASDADLCRGMGGVTFDGVCQ